MTDEQIRQLKELDSSFGLLEDVPEEKIDRMAAAIRRMKKEGSPPDEFLGLGPRA